MEAVTEDTREQLNTVLDALRNDREKSRRMLPDGRYVRDKGGEGTSSQEALYRYFSTYKVSLDDEKPAKETEAPVKSAASAEPVTFLQRLRELFN